MKNAHNTNKRLVFTRSTTNMLGKKISYQSKIFDLRSDNLNNIF